MDSFPMVDRSVFSFRWDFFTPFCWYRLFSYFSKISGLYGGTHGLLDPVLRLQGRFSVELGLERAVFEGFPTLWRDLESFAEIS